jgi:hypothetical protein
MHHLPFAISDNSFAEKGYFSAGNRDDNVALATAL